MEIWKKNLYVIIICQIIILTSFGFAIPFIPYYIQELGATSKSSIDLYTGLASFLPAFSMTIMSPVWGKLSDKYGKKKMLQRAMFFTIFTLLALSIVRTPNELLFVRLIQGLLTGTIAASASFVGSYTPKEHISFAIGTLTTSNAIGYAIGPAIGGIIADLTSYRISFTIGAAISLAGYLILTHFLNEDMSIYEKHFGFNLKAGKRNLKNFFSKNKTNINIEKLDITDKTFMATLSFIRFIRMMFVPTLPLYIVILTKQNENMASTVGLVNMLVGVATASAGFTIAKIGDKFNKSNLSKIFIVISLILSIFVYIANTFYTFLFFYIAMSFTLLALEPLTVSNSVENTKIIKKGGFFGLQSMSQNFGSMIAPMYGSIVAINLGYKFVILSISISIVILFISNELLSRRLSS